MNDALDGWVLEQSVDPDWYSGHGEVALGPCPEPGTPRLVELHGGSWTIGRQSISRNTTPDLDCSPDAGVSRRHAELTVTGGRLQVRDLGSANGTYVTRAGSADPEVALAQGEAREVAEGDRIHLGAWTRLEILRPVDATVPLSLPGAV